MKNKSIYSELAALAQLYGKMSSMLWGGAAAAVMAAYGVSLVVKGNSSSKLEKTEKKTTR